MTEVEGIILKKLESLENKTDRNTTAFNDFQLRINKEQAECKAELKEDVNKVRFGVIKMIALMAVSGALGGGVAQTILKLF